MGRGEPAFVMPGDQDETTGKAQAELREVTTKARRRRDAFPCAQSQER